MRIHIQNDPADPLFEITPAQWDAAAARAGEPGHAASFGDTPDAFAAAIPTAAALITASHVVRRLLPAPAPALRIVFCTSAGLDPLAPFDWLPPAAEVWNNSGTHATKGAEYVLMALLMLACRLPEIGADQRAQHWEKKYGTVLAGRRVVIVGLGHIGAAAAALAARHGMEVIGCRTRAAPHPDCARVVAAADLDGELPRGRRGGARGPADGGDAQPAGCAPDRAAQGRRGGGQYRPRRGAGSGRAVRRAGCRAGSAARCSTCSPPSRCRRGIGCGRRATW